MSLLCTFTSLGLPPRVQFTDTDKTLRIYNGNVGTITGLDAGSGQVSVRLDATGSVGREVTFSAGAFEGFRHGYAGTIYKGQGKDPGPDVSLPHRALAVGGELRGADPAAGERAGVCGARDGA